MANTMSGRGARGSARGTPAAVKAKPTMTAPAPSAAKAPHQEIIPSIKKGALSKDVGPAAIVALAMSYTDEQKALQLSQGADRKRYEVLSSLTLAISKAAKADTSIDLTATAKVGSDGQKAMNVLNAQLGLALGFREVIQVGKGDKVKDKIVWAKSVAQYFPMPGEDKDLPEVKRKDSFRGNFMTTLKKAAMTALGINERGIDAKMDKKEGTLMLSGPEVKKQFGQPSVLLNEVQSIAKGDEKVKLTEKPSFTAIAARAGEAHGKPVHRGSNTRGAAAQSVANPGLAFEAICKSMTQALERMKSPTEAVIKLVQGVESAVDLWLSNNAK